LAAGRAACQQLGCLLAKKHKAVASDGLEVVAHARTVDSPLRQPRLLAADHL